MRSIAPAVFLFLAFIQAAPLRAEAPVNMSDEVKNLSKKVEELKIQNQTILQNQVKILEELQVLKVRVRRS